MTAAVSLFGEPGAQALFVIGPRLPFVGPGPTNENVNSHCCPSEPESVITFGVSSLVETETALAVGGVFAGTTVTGTAFGVAATIWFVPDAGLVLLEEGETGKLKEPGEQFGVVVKVAVREPLRGTLPPGRRMKLSRRLTL